MGYDVALIASIDVPGGATALGARAIAAPRGVPDELEGFDARPLGKGAKPKAGALLEAFAARVASTKLPFGRRDAGDRIEIAALLDEEVFVAWGAWIAAVLREAGAIGGHGQLAFAGLDTSSIALSLAVDGADAAFAHESAATLRRLRETPQMGWLARAGSAKRRPPLPAFAWPKAAAKKRAPPAPSKVEAVGAGFLVAVSGELAFPARAASRWGREKVAAAAFPSIPPPLAAGDAPKANPAEHEPEVGEPGVYLLVSIGERTSIEGFIGPERLAFWGGRLAAFFLSAARHGASGRLRLLAPPGAAERGFVVVVDGGEGVVREAGDADFAEAATSGHHQKTLHFHATDLRGG